MDKHDIFNLMYPIGKFEIPLEVSENDIREWIWTIEEFPTVIIGKIKGLTQEELKWKYRPNGWNINQVVHHVSDSHMNAYIRFKLALTEDYPTIKPYKEGKWAELPDYNPNQIHLAISILESIHGKWYTLLKHMNIEDFSNHGYYHPESKQTFNLGQALGLYDWHCRHHREHISQAITFEGRFWE